MDDTTKDSIFAVCYFIGSNLSISQHNMLLLLLLLLYMGVFFLVCTDSIENVHVHEVDNERNENKKLQQQQNKEHQLSQSTDTYTVIL